MKIKSETLAHILREETTKGRDDLPCWRRPYDNEKDTPKVFIASNPTSVDHDWVRYCFIMKPYYHAGKANATKALKFMKGLVE